MITPAFAFENTGSRVYKIGRVGLDSGTQDTGGVYTAVLKTERISPLGEVGLVVIRRVAVRIWRTGAFQATMKVFVDGAQTTTFDAGGNKVLQSVSFTAVAPTAPPIESWIEASVNAPGTYVEVELDVASNTLTGIFLPAEAEVHFYPLRRAKERGAQSS